MKDKQYFDVVTTLHIMTKNSTALNQFKKTLLLLPYIL